MRKSRFLTGALIGVAMIGSSVATAEARPRHGGWHHHRHHDNGFNVGDAIGVAALVGAVAIVANSVSKDRKANERPASGEPASGEWADEADGEALALSGEDAAIDACAMAARDKASNGSGYAEIRDISAPQPIAGGFNIDGTVEQRAGYRDSAGDTRRFTCTIRDGRVAEVYLSRDFVSN